MKESAFPVAFALAAAVLFVSGCTTQGPPGDGTKAISSFDECVAAGYPVMESYPMQCRTPGPDGETFTEIIGGGNGGAPGSIGGQRDGHGCLGPAGYTWNATIGACVREWEIKMEMDEAARIAVDYLGREYATTVIEVIGSECIGCFNVVIEKGETRERTDVEMRDWVVTRSSIAYHQCTDAEKAAEICTMEYAPVCGHMADGSSQTYGNKCGACSAGAEYWESGEC